MDAILKNPFRILGLSSSATDVEIKERYTLLVNNLNNIEKIVSPVDRIFNKIEIDGKNFLNGNDSHYYSSDEPDFQPYRSLNTITDAYAKLQDPINKAFYSLFAFDLNDFNYSISNTDVIVQEWIKKYQIEERIVLTPNGNRDIIAYDFKSINSANYIIERGCKEVKITNLSEKKGNLIKTVSSYGSYLKDVYSISFDCEWIDGIENNSFGIYFGKDPSKSSFYTFGISANGYIYLSNTNEGQQINNNNFFGWRKVESLNGKRKNNLEIKKNKNSLDFLLNKILVHKIETQIDFYGVELGFLIYGNQTAIFSNFQLNFFKEDIAFAEDLQVTKSVFTIFKNLSIYFFLKANLCKNIQVFKSTRGYTNEISKTEYCPSLSQYNFDKAILLFGKLLNKLNLIETNTIPEYKQQIHSKIIDEFIKQILTFLLGSNKELISYSQSILKIQAINKLISAGIFEIIKCELKSSSVTDKFNTYEVELFNFEILALKEYSINENFFIGTVNNPLRVLGLNTFAKDKDIVKRVGDLLIYAEMDKIPSYKNDMFFGMIERTIDEINYASKKLEDRNLRLYYSLLWFVEENEFDFEFLNELRVITNIENEQVFQNMLVSRFDKYHLNKTNYENAVNDISNKLYLLFTGLRRQFNWLINLKYIKEQDEFCIHEYLAEKFIHHHEVEKSDDGIVINSESGTKVHLLENIYFDKEVDFSIECDVERVEGENMGNEYSFIFGKGKGGNFYQYGSTIDGIAFFHEVIEGKKNDLLLLSLKKIVVGRKTSWKLRYNKRFRCFNLIINNNPLKFAPFNLDRINLGNQVSFGDYIGIESIGFQKLKFSKFRITYPFEKEVFDKNLIVNENNYSSLINLITEQLSIGNHAGSQVFREILTPITLFGILLNHDLFKNHAYKVLGETKNVDIQKIELCFADDTYNFLKSYIEKGDDFTKRYFESFYSFSNSTQNYVLNRLFGKRIIEIEESILKTDLDLKEHPMDGLLLGYKLNQLTNENLLFIRKILTYTSYHYRVIANNLANKIIDCAIIYYNSQQESSAMTISATNEILKLIEYANKIALGGNARKRVDENLSFFKEMISIEMSKISNVALNKIEIFFQNTNLNNKTTIDIKSFILVCKADLKKLILYDGEFSSNYITLSNTLINRTLTCLIDRLAEIERGPMNRRIDLEIKYGILLDQSLEIFKELNELHKSPQTQQRLDKYTLIFQENLEVFNEPISKASPEYKTSNPGNTSTKKSEPAPPVNNIKKVKKEANAKKWYNLFSQKNKDGKAHRSWSNSNGSIRFNKYALIPVIVFFAFMVWIIWYGNSEFNRNINADTTSIKNNEAEAKIKAEERKWIGNKLYNGAAPYKNTWGQGIFDPNSDCYVVFKNGNNTDAIVCLEDVNDGSIIRNSYIQAGSNYKMEKLPVGNYKIKVFYGNDWNPEKMINNGVIKGGFENNIHFSISERESDWLKVFYNSKTYSYGEVTLYTVNDGNMQQRGIDSDEFFK